MSINALTSPGSILWCVNWPNHNSKPRPVLVIRRINDINGLDWVLVVYGTGERTSEKNPKFSNLPGTMEISSNDCHQHQLNEATLFDFSCIIPMELNSNNFSKVKAKLRNGYFQQAIVLFNNYRPQIKSIGV